jgi:hypothetical protein
LTGLDPALPYRGVSADRRQLSSSPPSHTSRETKWLLPPPARLLNGFDWVQNGFKWVCFWLCFPPQNRHSTRIKSGDPYDFQMALFCKKTLFTTLDPFLKIERSNEA